ncbi:MAG: hypothetical protein LBQ90_10335 [Synergistaceae bacterium]|nr:hypothetical protein [Synergistaceae bacterium]
MALQREDGGIQPGIRVGILTIRLPFIHYRFEWIEFVEALIMCAACMSAIPYIVDVLEIPYELAWSMVIINGILYNLHSLLGDPVIPGWITPSLPLTIAYLKGYGVMSDRIQAAIALQLMVAFFFFFMGVTGLAGKIVHGIPNTVKAGILLGAGFSSVYTEFAAKGRFGLYPITIGVSGFLLYFLMYSDVYRGWRERSKILDMFGKMAMVVAFGTAIVLGPLVGELVGPRCELGSIIKLPDIAGVLRLTLFHAGFPPLEFFIKGFSQAFVIYVIAFGDFVTALALYDDAKLSRKDEFVDLNPNRSNLICGLRNGIQAIFCPYPNMSGPMWSAAYTITVARYKNGTRRDMDSLWSGVGTFRWATLIGVMLVPVNGLLSNMLPVALSLSMLVQGYICVMLSMQFCRTGKDRGICGVMAAILAARGATFGLLAGFLLYMSLKSVEERRAEREEKRMALAAEEKAREAML